MALTRAIDILTGDDHFHYRSLSLGSDLPASTVNPNLKMRSVVQSPSGASSLKEYVSSIEAILSMFISLPFAQQYPDIDYYLPFLADRSYSVRVRSVSLSQVGIEFKLETHLGAKVQGISKSGEAIESKVRLDIWEAYMRELEEACIFTNSEY